MADSEPREVSGGGLLHTREQGLRVHGLANLGGLVAIAGLEDVEPDLLLGVLVDVAGRLPRVTEAKRDALREGGRRVLAERGTSKRAWRAWESSRDLHSVHLTSDQIRRLLAVLGRQAPADRESLGRALSLAVGS